MRREVAQAGSAPGLGPGGRRFESCLPDKMNSKDYVLCYFFILGNAGSAWRCGARVAGSLPDCVTQAGNPVFPTHE